MNQSLPRQKRAKAVEYEIGGQRKISYKQTAVKDVVLVFPRLQSKDIVRQTSRPVFLPRQLNLYEYHRVQAAYEFQSNSSNSSSCSLESCQMNEKREPLLLLMRITV